MGNLFVVSLLLLLTGYLASKNDSNQNFFILLIVCLELKLKVLFDSVVFMGRTCSETTQSLNSNLSSRRVDSIIRRFKQQIRPLFIISYNKGKIFAKNTKIFPVLGNLFVVSLLFAVESFLHSENKPLSFELKT